MTPLLLAAVLAVSTAAPSTRCLGPNLLAAIGRFEEWQGNDALGWDRTSAGNGVLHAGPWGRSAWSAGFQTVYGPAELRAPVVLAAASEWYLSAAVAGQEVATVGIQIQDDETGRYLNGAGQWQDEPADALVQQDPALPLRTVELVFTTETPDRLVHVKVHSFTFGVLQPNGFYDCSPGLCPTGWVDDVRLCAR